MSKARVVRQKAGPQGRKNGAHGVSRGSPQRDDKAPKVRKQRPDSPAAPELRTIPLRLEAEVQSGDSLPRLLLNALTHQNWRHGTFVSVNQKLRSQTKIRL